VKLREALGGARVHIGDGGQIRIPLYAGDSHLEYPEALTRSIQHS
jgi:hypothetical protein